MTYLEKLCCHPSNAREGQITAACWGLDHAYRGLFNTNQHSQGKEIFGFDDSAVGPAIAPTTATGLAV